MTVYWLDSYDPDAPFPHPNEALSEPQGLLAAGGDLSPPRLLKAYRCGIFPWYEAGQPILWWSPDPRAVLYPTCVQITRSLRKVLRHKPYIVTFDRAFYDVISACAAPRARSSGTWITPEMRRAYGRLHEQGHAHSVEVWDTEGALMGGLYGVAVGHIFCGESMFSWRPDASKVALVYLARHLSAWGFALIDCQLPSPHLLRMGAELIPRAQFLMALHRGRSVSSLVPWRIDMQIVADLRATSH